MQYQRILLAIDFSEEHEQVALRAAALAQRYAAQLTLLHVVPNIYEEPLYDFMSSLPADIDEQLHANAQQSLAELAQRIGLPEAPRVVETGAPKTEIIAKARELGTDLIVLGSHGAHGLGLLLGSTANAVLHGAPCDVLAVRIGT